MKNFFKYWSIWWNHYAKYPIIVHAGIISAWKVWLAAAILIATVIFCYASGVHQGKLLALGSAYDVCRRCA